MNGPAAENKRAVSPNSSFDRASSSSNSLAHEKCFCVLGLPHTGGVYQSLEARALGLPHKLDQKIERRFYQIVKKPIVLSWPQYVRELLPERGIVGPIDSSA